MATLSDDMERTSSKEYFALARSLSGYVSSSLPTSPSIKSRYSRSLLLCTAIFGLAVLFSSKDLDSNFAENQRTVIARNMNGNLQIFLHRGSPKETKDEGYTETSNPVEETNGSTQMLRRIEGKGVEGETEDIVREANRLRAGVRVLEREGSDKNETMQQESEENKEPPHVGLELTWRSSNETEEEKKGEDFFPEVRRQTRDSRPTPPPPPSPPKPPPPPATVPQGDKITFDKAAETGAAPPTGNPKKVAFMFLTRGPIPLAPLWAKFFNGQEGKFSIYIHTLENYEYSGDELPQVFRDSQIPSKNSSWGHISIVDAERRLLANAFMDPDNSEFILLSDSCIPLHDFDTIYNYTTKSGLSFVHLSEKNDVWNWNEAMAPLVPKEDWRKGSQWFHIKRELVPSIIQDEDYYLKFGWTDTKHSYPDEHFIPTLLVKRFASKLANRTLTFVRWPKWRPGIKTPHPDDFHGPDVSVKFLRQLRWGKKCEGTPVRGEPCFAFARKFRPGALPKLMRFSWALGY